MLIYCVKLDHALYLINFNAKSGRRLFACNIKSREVQRGPGNIRLRTTFDYHYNTFNSCQQPHDIVGHKLLSFFPAAPAAAGSTTATSSGGGEGVSGGERGMTVAGAGLPGFSITAIRFASYNIKKQNQLYIQESFLSTEKPTLDTQYSNFVGRIIRET